MEVTYGIKGFTCQKCVETVGEKLRAIPGVRSADVSLSGACARISAERDIGIIELNSVLSSSKYSVVPLHRGLRALLENMNRLVGRFAPLLMAIATVMLVTVAAVLATDAHSHAVMYYFMGSFFAVFGLLKAVNICGFSSSYSQYDLLAQRLPYWGYAYPFIELGLAALFFSQTLLPFALVATGLLMLQKTESVYRALRMGGVVQCACLGGFFSIPVTWVTFWEDVLMALMAVWMLAYAL